MDSLNIFRSINEEIRKGIAYNDRCGSFELGLITAWESGRELSGTKYKHLIEHLKNGALPKLSYKGGHLMPFDKDDYKKPTYKYKYGVYNYLAQVQGILGKDLDINPKEEYVLICGLTGLKTVFTLDINNILE